MIIFPAIDLKGGQVVRLAEGDMDRATIYGDDPAAQALIFADAGAEYLHVVDLDGSFAGESRNRAAVEAIVATMPSFASTATTMPFSHSRAMSFTNSGFLSAAEPITTRATPRLNQLSTAAASRMPPPSCT